MKLKGEESAAEYYVVEYSKRSSNNILRTEPLVAGLFISHPFCCLVPNYYKNFTICNYPNNFYNRPLNTRFMPKDILLLGYRWNYKPINAKLEAVNIGKLVTQTVYS
jgi:hypothetical protein